MRSDLNEDTLIKEYLEYNRLEEKVNIFSIVCEQERLEV